MSENVVLNNIKKYGAIIMLDSLGTKGIWKVKDPEDVLANWKSLVSVFKEDLENAKQSYKSPPRLYAFSDTIIITINEENKEKVVEDAGNLTALIMNGGLSVDINLRGCISIGTYYEGNDIVLGPAIDEAAEHYEVANWIGAHVTPSVYSVLTRMSDVNNIGYPYVKYNVPTKNGIIDTWAVEISNQLIEENQKIYSVKDMTGLIHKKLEEAEDISGSDKWKNLLDFMRFCQRKK